MTILASLARAYERMPDKSPPGYSIERIGFVVPLDADGAPAHQPISLFSGSGKKREARAMAVPASFKRPGVTPRAFFLWDNTAFALGVTASEGKDAAARFRAFRERHLNELVETDDEGLLAVRKFLERWSPNHFEALGWPKEMLDQNVVFGLESDRLANIYIHDRPAARAMVARASSGGERPEAVCLVTGERAPIARLHPSIKGVWGAQTAGASIVSFNLDAFESYGHAQGDNAPVSEAAAFAYTTALNRFLERDSRNRIQIGDASTVFWADASVADAHLAAEAATMAEAIFRELVAEGVGAEKAQRIAAAETESASHIDEGSEAAKVGTVLDQIRAGRPGEIRLGLAEHVRFHVLGLAPNAARLSVRFWLDDEFGELARRYVEHVKDMTLEPDTFREGYSIQRTLKATTLHVPRERGGRVVWQRPQEAKPPSGLSGEILRAVLTGTAYPKTMLSQVVLRTRAERGRTTFVRAAICKAVLNRTARLAGRKEDVPVALDRTNPNAAYRLGRLFALLERTQELALPGLNATIRDRYFAGASAAPARLFPILVKTSMHHISAARKDEKKRRLAFWLEKEMGEVWSALEADLPRSLKMEDQGRFQVGYFHQRYAKKDATGAINQTVADESDAAATHASDEEEDRG